MKEGDNLPPHGMEGLTLDPNWAWVAEDDGGRVVGLLLAAPCHGAVFLVRLISAHGAPIITVKALLTRFARDVLARGCRVAFVYLDLGRPTEQRLLKLIMTHGRPERHTVMAGNMALCATAVEDWTCQRQSH